jgi:DNA-binding MarR family transcriptional regulator
MLESQKNTRMLGAMLRIPFQAIVQRIDQGLRARGFTDLRPAHFVIFQHIRREGSRVTNLADQAQMTKQSMGDLVNYVEACGYLERVPDPNDRRAKLVRLTEKGQLLNAAARDVLKDTETEWAKEIGSEQMEALKQALQAIITIIEQS